MCWHQISNVEGINNKLKLLKCSGFGFRTFKTLKSDLGFFGIFLKI
ncbi:transposase [Microcoleus sp. MON1_C1]